MKSDMFSTTVFTSVSDMDRCQQYCRSLSTYGTSRNLESEGELHNAIIFLRLLRFPDGNKTWWPLLRENLEMSGIKKNCRGRTENAREFFQLSN